ncbi:MAG TPA: cysteine hydrolase family protein [Terriglobales bacterium]|nr:cysteine hydrolase family protein [Terriglobales bacterium]
MNRLLFWDVDTQADFLLPEGKLYVPGAEKIIPSLLRLTSFAVQHSLQIISPVDAHLEPDAEFRDYPPHCLAGTPGQKKIEGTVLPGHLIVPNRKIELPADLSGLPQIIIEKQATDVFTNPNVDEILARLGRDREIILYGVVTEICVAHAARGLIERGRHVHLVTDAIRGLDAARAEETILMVRRNGGMMLSTEEILSGILQPTR